MIDYVKFQPANVIADDLRRNSELDFKFTVSEKTSVIDRCIKAHYRSMTFKIYDNQRIFISGSLQKYCKGDNYGDFCRQDIENSLLDLNERFGIDPTTALLSPFEFGVNTSLPMDVDYLLNYILLHKTKSPDINTFNGNGTMLTFPYTSYNLKIYNKGRQCKLPNNILRTEIKLKRMSAISNNPLTTLDDFAKAENLRFLGNQLTTALNQLIIWNPLLAPLKMPESEREFILNCRNIGFWQDLKKDNPRMLQYNKERYDRIVKIYTSKSLKDLLKESVRDKVELLIG